MAVEDAILAIQIQESVTDARFGQELVKALHVRVVLQLLFVLGVHGLAVRGEVSYQK
jgi:hypothetical protein